jgi:hypothetical protein
MAGSAPGYAEDVLLRSGVTTAQIDDVSIEKRLSVPAPVRTEDDDIADEALAEVPADPSLARLDAIRKLSDKAASSLKRIELFAGIAVGILVISALLR